MSNLALPVVPSIKELLGRWEDRPHLDPDDAAAWARDLAELRAAILLPIEHVWGEDDVLSGNSPTAPDKPSSIP